MNGQKGIEDYIKSFKDVYVDRPFGENFLAYHAVVSDEDNSHIFALIKENSNPLQISLRCDPLLSKKLRQEYETVMPATNLNKKHWNTILCTGQVSEDDLKSLITISYNLAIR